MKKLVQIMGVAVALMMGSVAMADHEPIIIDIGHGGVYDHGYRVDLLAKIHGSQFYPGNYGIVAQVVSLYDAGYQSFALLGGRRMIGQIRGTAFVECRYGRGSRVGMGRTVIAGLEGAQFINPCGQGGADRIDFYLDAHRFDRTVNYKVVGIR